jgi:hypothetical protein
MMQPHASLARVRGLQHTITCEADLSIFRRVVPFLLRVVTVFGDC